MNVGMLSIGGVGAAVICMAALDGSDGSRVGEGSRLMQNIRR